MVNIYIWGTGKTAKKVLEALDGKICDVKGFIDNNINKIGTLFESKKVYYFKDVFEKADYIVISAMNYQAIIYQLNSEGYNADKTIWFFGDEKYKIFDDEKRRIAILELKLESLEKNFNSKLNNLKYEMFDAIQNGDIWIPKMGDTSEDIDKIVNGKCSMIRFGDGEFEQIRGKERAPFQKYNIGIAEKLKNIIKSNNEKLLIAIADNYGNLEKYSETIAYGIRKYMTKEVRKFHYTLLDKNRVYYDAYMFKGYMPYKNKELSEQRFSMVEKIWKGRDIVIVEGEYTRTGACNDLLAGAKSIERIIAPTKNASEVYDKLLEETLKINKEKLILVVLGPVGKCLAYDLFNVGYQVVDIGQIDMDYEWYLAGQGVKVPNPKKYVSQLPEMEITDIDDDEYKEQIIVHIE